MGGDGGCIATQGVHARDVWIRFQQRRLGARPNTARATGGMPRRRLHGARRAIRVQSRPVGGRLKAPVVSDAFGQLFNKLDVLEQLSSKKLPEAFSHIRGLRDLIDVKSTPPKGEKDYVHGDGAPFCQCPLTGASFDGSEPFVVVRTSGWLIAQKAISELGEGALQDEYGPFTKERLVTAAPDPTVEASEHLAEKSSCKSQEEGRETRQGWSCCRRETGKKEKEGGAAVGRRGRGHRAPGEGADAAGPFTKSGARRHVPLGRNELQTGRGDALRGDGAAADAKMPDWVYWAPVTFTFTLRRASAPAPAGRRLPHQRAAR